MRNLLFTFCTLCVFHLLIAQPISYDDTMSREIMLKGKQCLNRRAYDSAIYYYKQADRHFLATQRWEAHVDALNKICFAYRKTGKYNESLAYGKLATEAGIRYLPDSAEVLGAAHHYLAVAHRYHEQYNDAVKNHKRSIHAYTMGFGELSPQVADSYDALGVTWRKMRQLDSSIWYHQKSVEIYKTTGYGLSRDIASVYRNIGAWHNVNGTYHRALAYFKKALLLKKKLLDTDHKEVLGLNEEIAKMYYLLGQYKQALDYYEKSQTVYSTQRWRQKELASCYDKIAVVHADLGAYELALEYLNKALHLKEKILGYVHPDVALSYNNIGNINYLTGDLNQALLHYTTALEIKRKTLGTKHRHLSSTYRNIGLVHAAQGDYDQSIIYFGYAGEVMSVEQDHPHFAKFFDLLGSIYGEKSVFHKRNELDESSIHFKTKYLDINRLSYDMKADQNYPLPETQIERRLTPESEIRKKMKQWSGEVKEDAYLMALHYHQKAINILSQKFGRHHPDLARAYKHLGIDYAQAGKPEMALQSFQAALIANSADFSNDDKNFNPSPEDCFNQNDQLEVLSLKSKLLSSIYEKRQNMQALETAYNTYEVCDALIDKIRRSHQKYADKLISAARAFQIYEGAIEVSYLLHEIRQSDQYLKKAFYYSEKSKSTVLTEALSGIKAKNFGGVPDSLLEKEQSIKGRRSFYESKLRNLKSSRSAYDTTQLAYYQDQLFDLNREYNNLATTLENDFPNYHRLRYKDTVSSINQIKQQLKQGQVLVEYFVGREDLYIFIIDEQGFNVQRKAIKGALIDNINRLRSAIGADHKGMGRPDVSLRNFTNAATKLYDLIFDGVINNQHKNYQSLIIIPANELNYLPFETLLTTQVPETNMSWESLPYLLHQYTITYAYSATWLFQDYLTVGNGKQKGFIGFAPIYAHQNATTMTDNPSSAKYQYQPLAWNKSEIEKLQHHLQGNVWHGMEATENKFKEASGDYQVIHLAMHAYVDDKEPMSSRLIFANKEDSVEDGLLYAHEIYNLTLPARMIVLSACQTAFGQLQRGEGIMSLGRAFSYAGCPSVVMSHWPANDESTAFLMDRFYENLAKGNDKDVALRNAKLDVLSKGGAKACPFYWAPFFVNGDTAPLVIKSRFDPYRPYLIALILLVLLLTGFYFQKQRRQSAVHHHKSL